MIVNLILLALVLSPLLGFFSGSNEADKRTHAKERCGRDCAACERLYRRW